MGFCLSICAGGDTLTKTLQNAKIPPVKVEKQRERKNISTRRAKSKV